MKKIAVILSGCGYLDGSEITESTSLLINLSEHNASYKVFAPNKNLKTAAHLDVDLTDSSPRNVMEESARITRGDVYDLEELNPNLFDGIAIPGGYGVAKNLCSWASDGAECSVDKNIQKIITEFHKDSKPILAICIAPALVARVLGPVTNSLSLTIGSDKATAEQIEKTGAEHVECSVTDFVTDRENKVISTPAYMYSAKPHEVFEGVSKATGEFLEMC